MSDSRFHRDLAEALGISKGDQADAAFVDLARMQGIYFQALLDAGFRRREAMEMVLTAFHVVLNNATAGSRRDDSSP